MMFNNIMICVFVVAFVAFLIYTIKRNKAIVENGIETKAVVSRIKEDVGGDDEGVSYSYYVSYTTRDGQTVEARINDLPAHTHVGDTIRIKYLPEKPKYVLLIKQNNKIMED